MAGVSSCHNADRLARSSLRHIPMSSGSHGNSPTISKEYLYHPLPSPCCFFLTRFLLIGILVGPFKTALLYDLAE